MNSALQLLANKLSRSFDISASLTMREGGLDKHLATLQQHVKAGSSPYEPEDLQAKAVRRFWETTRLDTLKEARLVSFGMCLPSHPNGPCLLEDSKRFDAALSSDTGVDQWVKKPQWFRRCYQGLVRSYFSYDDRKGKVAPDEGRKNWKKLREYLHDRSSNIIDPERINPDWAITAVENKGLFSENPCLPYAKTALSGDMSYINRIREQLGITDDSWFTNELVLSQVRHAVALPYEEFKAQAPNLLTMLASLARHGTKVRNRGLSLILDAYAQGSTPAIFEQLRDVSVDWWGNPWLPSTAAQWGGVSPQAREMVSEWLRGEFIETFFTKLAQDGIGDRRRANFWQQYVKSMTNVQFALGPRALNSPSRDFAVLLEKMKGLYTELKDSGSENNAFIMTLGNLVAVEFSATGNALYGYQKGALPFVFDSSEPLRLSGRAVNTLKDRKQSVIWLLHKDNIHGWNRWEDMYEATLRESFGILPDDALPRAPRATSPTRAASDTSRSELNSRISLPTEPAPNSLISKYGSFAGHKLKALSKYRGFDIADLRTKGGNIWAYTQSNDPELIQLFQSWGFQYKAGKGWWK